MNVICGNEQDIESIAELYREAFPESVDFFYRGDAGERVLRIIALGFHVLSRAGCTFFVAKDSSGSLSGYSIAASDDVELNKAIFRGRLALEAVGEFITGRIRLRFTELLRLGANGLVMTVASRALPKRTSFGRIMSIAVRRDARGQGLGRRLLLRALQYLANEGVQVVRLEVRPLNRAAYELYRTEGFSEIGVTRDLQGSWVAMEKQLL